MKLAELVAVSGRVAATHSRRAKVTGLADLLSRLPGDEIEIAVGFLTGEPRQGKVGIGAASLWAVQVAPATTPGLDLAGVDRAIGSIPGITGRGSKARRLMVLEDLLGRATGDEQDFIRRLLIGELRQGALQGLMMDAVSAASGIDAALVRRATMLDGDLGAIARLALTDGEGALTAVRLRPLRPVRPMLASTSGSVEEAMASAGHASVEWKLDGARIQAHRLGDDVALFTRSLNEVTDRMPEISRALLGLPVSAIVLDGETLTHDERGRPRRFEQTMSRFGSQESAEGSLLLPFFFDILHVDGRDLIDEPLGTRIELLERYVPPEFRVPRVVTGSAPVAESTYTEARRNRHEGVMVKAIDSTYEAGRRGSAWLKVKHAHHLDLVVLAAEWGHGRRTGWLSNLHLGARDRDTGEFVMLGKTFKGLTDEMLAWQTERFLQIETGRERHVVFLRPELVVEVAFDGVLPSPVYRGGVALRFARVKRYRPDRKASGADTIQTIYRIFKGRT